MSAAHEGQLRDAGVVRKGSSRTQPMFQALMHSDAQDLPPVSSNGQAGAKAALDLASFQQKAMLLDTAQSLDSRF